MDEKTSALELLRGELKKFAELTEDQIRDRTCAIRILSDPAGIEEMPLDDLRTACRVVGGDGVGPWLTETERSIERLAARELQRRDPGALRSYITREPPPR